MTALPRAACPVCHKSVAVRTTGQLREHYVYRPQAEQDPSTTLGRMRVCRGSGLAPDTEVCRVCGCSYFDPCEEGCWWVPDPEQRGSLCSSCAIAIASSPVSHEEADAFLVAPSTLGSTDG